MNFSEIFDTKQLSDVELGQLAYVLNSPSYVRVFKPYLERLEKSLDRKLRDPSWARKADISDDFVRGGLVMIEGFNQFFEGLLAETNTERIHKALSSEEEYESLRKAGGSRPAGQTVQPADVTDYNPDEDF